MKNQEILKAAVKKAQENGYLKVYDIIRVYDRFIDYGATSKQGEKVVFARMWLEQIIFSPEFAKAFFGEEDSGIADYPTKDCEYHLQQMVVSEDRIKYLEQFL